MKKLIYQYESVTEVYNPETELVEKQPILINTIVPNPTEAAIEKAKKEAYNGEYTIEDDGEPEPEKEPTTDEVLNAMLGVM